MRRPIVATRIEPRRRKLALLVTVGSLGLLGSWWLVPGVADRLIHGSVGDSCEKRMSVWGTDGDRRIFGRHCRIGTSTSQTESGFFVSFEYARDGQVLLWGRGARPTRADERAELSLALVRTPGDRGRWVCAGAGTWRTSEAGDHELELTQVGELLDEQDLIGDGTLIVADADLTATIGTWSIAAPIGGWGCSQSGERCDLSASELSAVRVFVRSEDGRVEHGFVLRENQRAATSVGLSVAAGEDSSFERSDTGPNVTLTGLSALALCPQQTPGRGSLKLRWTD